MDKKELRARYKELRKHVTDRKWKEERIASSLMSVISGYDSVFIYESIGGEVSTRELIKRISENAKVCVPEVCGKDMKLNDLSGGYADEPCKVTVVPLIAFDETRNRIGFGGGYYDRYLSKSDTLSVGIAFDEQQCEVFEKEEFDVPLDMIITPTRILRAED